MCERVPGSVSEFAKVCRSKDCSFHYILTSMTLTSLTTNFFLFYWLGAISQNPFWECFKIFTSTYLQFCLSSRSLFLYRLGKAPPMLDLMGKATFTAEQISAMKSALDAYGLPMPQFKRIGGLLAEELPVDEAAFHAAIMAINDALDGPDASKTLKALNNPNACLQDIDPDPGTLLSHSVEKSEFLCHSEFT